jgi:NitT/TauT family transport system substrate-binding protein
MIGLLKYTALATLLAGAAHAEHVRFLTDSFFIGPTAPYLYGAEKGFYADQGIDIDVEPSAGSADGIAKIAAGSADAAIADISTLIEFASHHPDQAPVAVLMVQDASAQSIVSLKTAGIETPADLVGKRLGTAQLDATSRMFPLFAKINHLALDQLNRIPVDQQLRDTLLAKGDFDAAMGFDYAIIFKLTLLGHKMSDINAMHYRDWGLNLYGNAIVVSQALLKAHPETVKGLVLATVQALIQGEQDRDGVIAALVHRDRLMLASLERVRLDWAYATLVMTPWVREHGLGTTDPERLRKNIDFVVEGFGLATKPAVSQIITDAFLPPENVRHFQQR